MTTWPGLEPKDAKHAWRLIRLSKTYPNCTAVAHRASRA